MSRPRAFTKSRFGGSDSDSEDSSSGSSGTAAEFDPLAQTAHEDEIDHQLVERASMRISRADLEKARAEEAAAKLERATKKKTHADPNAPVATAASSSSQASPARRTAEIAGSPAGPVPASTVGTNDSIASTQSGGGVSSPPPPETLVASVAMEFGDEYSGEIVVVDGVQVPHGQGTLQSTSGKHCYVGEFNMRQREGSGKLVTERFVLWCKWKNNRPDLTSSARIDYTNGDKYAGYLSLFHDPSAMQSLMRTQTASLSKFSIWVRATSMVRERWGEIVYTDGSRFFGQWERNMPNGFGVYIGPMGDRYVGNFHDGKFHDDGVLFTSQQEDTSVTVPGGFASAPGSVGTSRAASPQAAGSPGNAMHMDGTLGVGSRIVGSILGNGAVYQGVWEKGAFDNEEGIITFPCGTQVTASWSKNNKAETGDLYFQSRPTMMGKKWTAYTQWDPLLIRCAPSTYKREMQEAKPVRSALESASTREEIQTIVHKMIHTNNAIVNAVKIFRRCFYCIYGTCGKGNELGAGMGGNKLGWCYVRNAFGGCIHRGHGKPIAETDINQALGDIVSFVSSTRRWIDEVAGEAGANAILEHDCDAYIGKTVLDVVLTDVHPPLFNLYVHVYARDQVRLSTALSSLERLTLDDLGVSFGRHGSEEKLFDPYADAVHSVERLAKSNSLSAKLAALRNWSAEIDSSTRMAQVNLRDTDLQAVKNVVRNRVDMNFSIVSADTIPSVDGAGEVSSARFTEASRMRSDLEDPKGSASPGSGALDGPKEDSFASSPTMFRMTEEPQMETEATAEATILADNEAGVLKRHTGSTKRILVEAANVQSGSADDLLPIHQFVLVRAKIPYLYAHAQLLVDLSADDTFVESTSQDAFCITTLHACVSILPELDPQVRDTSGIITPLSVFEKRVEEALGPLLIDSPSTLLVRLQEWIPLLFDGAGEQYLPLMVPVPGDGVTGFERRSDKATSAFSGNEGIFYMLCDHAAFDFIRARVATAVAANEKSTAKASAGDKSATVGASETALELQYAATLLDAIGIELYLVNHATPSVGATLVPPSAALDLTVVDVDPDKIGFVVGIPSAEARGGQVLSSLATFFTSLE